MSQDTARRVLRIEAQAIQDVLARLDSTFDRAVDLFFACKGRVVVAGMGKSGIVGKKISATLSSTGTPSFFLHPAEALHGDLGMIARGDVMLAVSYGGETREIIALLDALKRLEIPLVALTGISKSTIAQASDVVLDASVNEEACSLDDFAALHPAGSLGKRLLRVDKVMHAGDALPKISPQTPMPEAFHEMSAKKLGMTTIVNADGTLAGILTDGDLRRLMEKHGGATLSMTAAQCLNPNPQTVKPSILASEALTLMEKPRITSVVVLDDSRHVLGVVPLHDLWGLQLV